MSEIKKLMRKTVLSISRSVLVILCAVLTGAFIEGVPDQNGCAQAKTKVDMSQYVMAGANGGRAGLPEVKLWIKRRQLGSFNRGVGWSYPSDDAPVTRMKYPNWSFWQFALSDALLQLVTQEATDPHTGAQKLGLYFSHLPNSGTTCWSKFSAPQKGLVIDLSKEIPLTESFAPRRFITYGTSYELFFNGKARFLLTVGCDRHVTVELVSSSLPPKATKQLEGSLETLDGHPVVAFPDGEEKSLPIQVVAEFIIERKPGVLKKALYRSLLICSFNGWPCYCPLAVDHENQERAAQDR